MRTRSAQLSRAAFQLIILSSALFAGCGGDAPVDMDDAGVTVCTAHTQCDDGLFCNGAEQCVPDSAEAGADGCVTAAAPCIANVTCDEAADACGTACTEGDMDGDGHDAVACGGDDCDDTDADRTGLSMGFTAEGVPYTPVP
uniref:Lipoprotein n=1 Tax=uncultured bacterium A1Q1_fos_479 TaxID=1256575 RepID=L7VSY6_9BACT|nr:hypothetical protein [uncultured bacterium A1Q1_fos_479]